MEKRIAFRKKYSTIHVIIQKPVVKIISGSMTRCKSKDDYENCALPFIGFSVT